MDKLKSSSLICSPMCDNFRRKADFICFTLLRGLFCTVLDLTGCGYDNGNGTIIIM